MYNNKQETNTSSSYIGDTLKAAKEYTQFLAESNNPIRMHIIGALLCFSSLSIDELCQYLGKSWPTIDKHTRILAENQLILAENHEISDR